MLRFLLKLLNIWLIILTNIHNLISIFGLIEVLSKKINLISYEIWYLVRNLPGSECSPDLEQSFCHTLEYSFCIYLCSVNPWYYFTTRIQCFKSTTLNCKDNVIMPVAKLWKTIRCRSSSNLDQYILSTSV